MTKNRIVIAGALLILALLIILPLLKPHKEQAAAEIKPAIQESVQQAGLFELPPAGGSSVGQPIMAETATTAAANEEPRKRTPGKARHIEEEPQDKGYDSMDPGLVPNPPKSPSPETLRNMQKKGIVLY